MRTGISDARRHRLLTVVAAVAATFAIWLIADPIAGIDLATGQDADHPTRTIGPVAVVLVTAIAGLAGWALVAFIEHRTARPRTVWIACATALLLLSFLGPLGAVTTGATIALLGMHLAAAAVLIPGLAYDSSPRRPATGGRGQPIPISHDRRRTCRPPARTSGGPAA
jgi:hypothetical protein